MEHTKQKVLLVDDSALDLQILRDILESDYEILCATSGEQALSIVMSDRVDLILLDVLLPGIDGYQVCALLKENVLTKNIPVIFVTALRNAEEETKGLELGAIDYIFKPFNSAITKVRVKNHLELKEYRDFLEKLSLMDGLTGIANRRYLDEVLDKEWRRGLREGDLLSVIMMDIDFFKKYNDHYGHLAGDDCLRRVSRTLKKTVQRGGDFAARYGGEEFVVLLPSTSLENAVHMAEKVRKNIESLKIKHQMSDVHEYVTVSLGVATVRPERYMNPTSLIERADLALYQAKHDGRNRVRYDGQ